MKNIFTALFCIVAFNVTFSQSDFQQSIINFEDGKHVQHYNNGNILSEFETLDKKLIGVVKFYKKNGSLIETNEYVEGKLHGKSIIYNKNNQVYTERTYSNDSIIFEKCIFYYKNSKVIQEEWIWEFKNNQNKQILIEHFSQVYNYVNNKTDLVTLYGTRYKYYKNGNSKSIEYYYNGQKSGQCKYYSIDNILTTITYVNGKKEK